MIDKAFVNYRQDVQNCAREHGSIEAALRSERFPEFVGRTRAANGLAQPPNADRSPCPRDPNKPPPTGPEPPPNTPGQAPKPRDADRVIRFRVVNERGQVLIPQHQTGHVVQFSKSEAKELKLGATIIGYALPDGVVELGPRDIDYLRGINQAFQMALLVTLPFWLLGALLWGSILTRPLRRLSSALTAMGEGNLSQRMSVQTRDEIDVLGRSFNRMREQHALSYSNHEQARDAAEAARVKILELSIRDELTNLYNRRYFNQRANFVLEQTKRNPQPVSLMIADIDSFKRINDTIGHSTGDAVLREVARNAQDNARGSDVIARYGGEEFVLLLPNTRLENAVQVCERLRNKIAERHWYLIHPTLSVTISMGVSSNQEHIDLEPLIAQADRRLYEAKNTGKNRVCF